VSRALYDQRASRGRRVTPELAGAIRSECPNLTEEIITEVMAIHS